MKPKDINVVVIFFRRIIISCFKKLIHLNKNFRKEIFLLTNKKISRKMLIFTFVCSIILMSAPMYHAQCVYQQDIDYFGNDLTFVYTGTVEACCNLCSFYPGCVAYTYVKDSTACWLKSAVPTNGVDLASPGRN